MRTSWGRHSCDRVLPRMRQLLHASKALEDARATTDRRGGEIRLLLLLLLLARPSTLVDAEASLLLLRGEYATLRAGVRVLCSVLRAPREGAGGYECNGRQRSAAAERSGVRALSSAGGETGVRVPRLGCCCSSV